jgi:hypothetical protein
VARNRIEIKLENGRPGSMAEQTVIVTGAGGGSV